MPVREGEMARRTSPLVSNSTLKEVLDFHFVLSLVGSVHFPCRTACEALASAPSKSVPFGAEPFALLLLLLRAPSASSLNSYLQPLSWDARQELTSFCTSLALSLRRALLPSSARPSSAMLPHFTINSCFDAQS